jgi:hypothetical protein
MEQNIPTAVLPEQVKLDVVYTEKISRLFIFRGLWIYILIFPLMVWALWISLIGFVHFWYKLILGKRNRSWWEKEMRFFRYSTKWGAYLQSLMDKRPKFTED